MIAAVRSGAADLGICSGLTLVGDLDAALYRRDTLVLAMPFSHRLVGYDAVTLEDILSEDMVSLQDGSSIRAHVEACAVDAGRSVHTRVQVMSFDGVRRMVQANLSVAILPFGAVAPFLEAGHLAMIPVAEPWAERDLLLVRRRDEEAPKAVRALLRYPTAQAK